MRAQKVMWFSHWDVCIGIVLAHDEDTNEKKAYIGVGDGEDEAQDVKKILRMGAKVTLDVAHDLYSHLYPRVYKRGKTKK